ncbi:hypothetical protein VNO77_02858 [Canavalia gladiata]|uniref:Uncharacterized protein n=1 Tax=Canavalia gladiata TaxID=3824 RepID=A0AAN9RBN8_CANGL
MLRLLNLASLNGAMSTFQKTNAQRREGFMTYTEHCTSILVPLIPTALLAKKPFVLKLAQTIHGDHSPSYLRRTMGHMYSPDVRDIGHYRYALAYVHAFGLRMKIQGHYRHVQSNITATPNPKNKQVWEPKEGELDW